MIQALQLYLNLQGRGLVTSPNDSTSPALSFMQGDTYQLVLNGLLPVLDNSLTLFAAAHIDWSRLSAGITLIDAPPTGGTFQVQVGTGGTALTTPVLGFTVGKGGLQAALNALANVIAAGGIDVVTTGASNIYQLNWRIPDNILPLAVVRNELSPLCLVRIAVDPDVAGKVELKLYQAPVTLTDQFSLPTPPLVTVSEVRAGSVLANEVQRITIPDSAVGSFALIWLTVSGTLIPVSTVSAAAIEANLNAPFYAVNSSDKRFSVTNTASGLYDVEFVGVYAQTAGLGMMGIETFDQLPIDTPVGTLSLDNQAIEDFLDGAATAQAFFEIRAYDSLGNKTMLAHLPVVIVNDGIDDEVLSVIGTIATRVDTVYVYPDPDPSSGVQALAIAKLGTVYTNPVLAQNFVFTHNFGTMAVDVVVLVLTGTGPDTWQKVPDDQYEVDILNDSQVQIFFAENVPAAPAIGSVQVWICTLAATPIQNNFRLTTDQVDGAGAFLGTVLTQILDQLASSLPTGWPNIPANKIAGTISASQIDLTGLSNLLATNAAFISMFENLGGDSTFISNFANAALTNTAFFNSLVTLLGNTALLTTLMGNLVTTPGFIAGVKSAVGSMVIPGLMTLPFAPLSEILFTTIPTPATLSTRAPYMLPQVGSVEPTALPVTPLPAAVANTVWVNNTGVPVLISGGGMIRSAYVAAGGFVASDGRILFAANNTEASSFYPAAFERELWRIYVDDKMLVPGKTLTAAFAVGLQLVNATNAAMYSLVIEKGALPGDAAPAGASLSSVVWDTAYPLVKQRIILTPTLILHNFGAIIARAADVAGVQTLTAQGVYYSTAYAAPAAPPTANFVLRARLIEFDTEDSIPNARGWVSYQLVANSYGELGATIA